MNDDGDSVKIPHGPQVDESQDDTSVFSTEAPEAEQMEEPISEEPETIDTETIPDEEIFPETNTDMSISHEEPIEVPEAETPDATPMASPNIDAEPVDIFATEEEKAAEATQASATPTPHSRIANNPFVGNSRAQTARQNPSPAVPQFFNDAIVANTPVEQQPKPVKKGLLLGVGIGTVVLIVVVVLVLTLKGGNGGGVFGGGNVVTDGSGTKVNVGARKEFNRYANFLLYGNDSTEDLKNEYNENESYSYQQKISDMDVFDEVYASTISDKFDVFYDKFYNANPDLNDGEIFNKIEDYHNIVHFVKTHPSDEKYTADTIAQLYIQQGSGPAKSKANEQIEKYNDDSNSISQEFYNLKKQEYKDLITFLDQADNAGCIDDDSINESCINKHSFTTDSKKDLKQLVGDNAEEAEMFITGMYERLGIDCWTVFNAIRTTKE